MLFNSHLFIFIFLPLSLAGYFLLNHFGKPRFAKLFLVGMSLWFYAYFHLSYLFIILSSILFNYMIHLLLTTGKRPRLLLFLGVAGNVGILCYYKYFDFLLENINLLFHTDFSLLHVLMPLGISFFTFQQIGFLADTASGKAPRENFLDYALFVVFFPQLIAGPIVSHEEMISQFKDSSLKAFRFDHFYRGIRIFTLGLSKKVLLADTFGKAADWGFANYVSLGGFEALLVILFYTFQLYFDFSGYCDMARGIGSMFNIEIAVNFLSPYKSRSIIEFWDRWHITLGRFFTRYVYIPLGGNRKGAFRTYCNILIVFLISGIWHGAGWTFVVWGCLHGVLNVLTHMWQKLRSRIRFPKVRIFQPLSVLLTFGFVTLTWCFFRASTISQAVCMLKNVFTMTGAGLHKQIPAAFELSEFFYVMKFFGITGLPGASLYCMIGFLIAAVILIFFCKNIYETEKTYTPSVPRTLYLAFLFVWSVLSLSGVSSFLYFNF